MALQEFGALGARPKRITGQGQTNVKLSYHNMPYNVRENTPYCLLYWRDDTIC